MKRKTYSVGVVGCGRVAWLLEQDCLRGKPATHAWAFHRSSRFKLVCACDRDLARLKDFGDTFGLDSGSLYTDFVALLKSSRPDVLVVSTWTDTHTAITCAAAKVGVKLILCEKPLARTLKEGRKMLASCRKYGTTLLINHERRYDRAYQKLREWIKTKKWGEVRTVYANVLAGFAADWRTQLDIVGGGPLMHDGTHLVDILEFLLGRPNGCRASLPPRKKGQKVEDTIYAMIDYPGDVKVFLEAGGRRKYFNFELDIQFERGRVRYGNEYADLFVTDVSRRYEGFRELEPVPFPVIKNQNQNVTLVREIAALLDGRKSVPSSDGTAGFQALETIMGIYASAVANGEMVHFPFYSDHHPLKDWR